MTRMQLFWIALGLTTAGFLLTWYGASFQEVVLWVGLIVFAIGMLLGPVSRLITEPQENGGD